MQESTSRDDKGNVIQTKYQLDNNDFEETGSTKYSEQELSSTRSLMNESTASIVGENEEEPESVPFDQVLVSEQDVQDATQNAQNAHLRRSLIENIKDEGDKIVDMLESNAMIKVNAFNSAD